MSVNEAALKSELENFQRLLEQEMSKNEPNPRQVEFIRGTINNLKAQLGEPEAEQAVYPHTQLFDFDEYAETGSTILNEMVDALLRQQYLELHNKYNEQIEDLESNVRGHEEERTNWEYQNRELQGKLQLALEANQALVIEKNEYKNKAEDYEGRFTAAADELRVTKEEQVRDKAEIDRLTKENKRLAEEPKTIQLGQADVIIPGSNSDIEYLRKRANEEKNSRRKVYGMGPLPYEEDPTGKTWQATYADGAEAGERFTFPGMYKGRYQEVSPEEARFLREQAQSTATSGESSESGENTITGVPLVTEEVTPIAEVQFPQEEETVLPVHQPSDIGGVVPQALVTFAELEARLATFKQEVIKEITGEVA